jgi:hypothetical protein
MLDVSQLVPPPGDVVIGRVLADLGAVAPGRLLVGGGLIC